MQEALINTDIQISVLIGKRMDLLVMSLKSCDRTFRKMRQQWICSCVSHHRWSDLSRFNLSGLVTNNRVTSISKCTNSKHVSNPLAGPDAHHRGSTTRYHRSHYLIFQWRLMERQTFFSSTFQLGKSFVPKARNIKILISTQRK